MTDMMRKARINIPRRLLHINMFSKSTIEEGVLDVKLPKRPFVGHNKRKHNTNSGSLDNRTKSVSVVETGYLCIAFGNKASFVTFNSAIRIILNLV